MVKYGWIIALLLYVCTVSAQQNPLLMRVNGKEVLRAEFEYGYGRWQGQQGAKKLPPEAYVEVFADRKLKVAAAEAAGLDTVAAFRQQLEEFRGRQIRLFLTDEPVAAQVARRFYDEMRRGGTGKLVRVSHIFKYLPQNISAAALHEAEARMDSLYEWLRTVQGRDDFDRCVRACSDDSATFWVSRLQMPVEFEEVAFRLQPGEISAPFFTPKGIHIVKVLERKETPPFEDVEDEIVRDMDRRHYEKDEGVVAKVEALKKAYCFLPDATGMAELLAAGRTDRTLFLLDGTPYTYKEFSLFAAAHPQGIGRQLDGFIAKSVLDYANARLEQRHPELQNALSFYRDSLLADKITYEEVDKRALADTAGMEAYFVKHRSAYNWEEPRYRGAVLHGTTKRVAKQARNFLKHLPEAEWADAVRLTFNAGGTVRIQLEQGTFAPGDNAYVDEWVFKRGKATPLLSYPFTAVLGEKLKGPKDSREAGGQLAADYRNYLLQRWTAHLRTSGKVEINQEVLKTVNKH